MSFFSPASLSPSARSFLDVSPRQLLLHQQQSTLDHAALSPPSSKQHSLTWTRPRRPLGFLSPNLKRWGHQVSSSATTAANKPRSRDTRAQHEPFASPEQCVKRNVIELQQQLCDLESSRCCDDGSVQDGHAHPRGGYLSLSAASSTASTADLAALHAKLETIQDGLDLIETERKALTAKQFELQKSKTQLEKDLQRREAELSSLSRRLAAQAAQVKAATQLSVERNQLQQQVQDLQSQLDAQHTQHGCVDALQQQLAVCEQSRREVTQQLQTVQHDRNATSEQLANCLATMDRLTQEKRQWDQEKRRMERATSLALEQQRLQHEHDKMNVQQNLAARLDQVAELETIVREKDGRIDALVQQQRTLTTQHEERLRTARAEQRQALTVTTDEHEQHVTALQLEYHDKTERLHDKLDERSRMIASLQEEVSRHMSTLMSTTEQLAQHQQDSRLVAGLTADVEALREECDSLQELLHERDTEILELSAEIIKLELEKELMDTSRLDVVQQQLAEAQQAKSELQALYGRQLAQAQASIKTLRQQLTETEAGHDAATDDMRQAHSSAMTVLQEQVRQLQNEAVQQSLGHNQSLTERDNKVMELKKELRCLHEQTSLHQRSGVEQIQALEQQVRHAQQALAYRDDELRELRCVELHDLQEQLTAVESNRQKSVQDAAAAVTAASVREADLLEQLQQARSDTKNVELCWNAQQSEAQRCIHDLQEQVEQLQRDHGEALDQTRDRNQELVEQRELGQQLTRELRDLQAKYHRLQQSSQTSAKVLEKKLDGLQVNLTAHEDMARSANSSAQKLKVEVDMAKQELKSTEAKLIVQDEQMSKLEEALQFQTARVAALQTTNSELESKVAVTERRLHDEADEARLLQLDLIDARQMLDRTKREMQQKGDEAFEQVLAERHLREIVEADLASTKDKLQALKVSNKTVDELQKENEDLQNKVKRQETYLKRKLEKEKALRQRGAGSGVVPLTETTNRTTNPTPLETDSLPPTNMSVSSRRTAKPSPVGSRIPAPVTRSGIIKRTEVATRSTATDTSSMLDHSLDWELDSLLAD